MCPCVGRPYRRSHDHREHSRAPPRGHLRGRSGALRDARPTGCRDSRRSGRPGDHLSVHAVAARAHGARPGRARPAGRGRRRGLGDLRCARHAAEPRHQPGAAVRHRTAVPPRLRLRALRDRVARVRAGRGSLSVRPARPARASRDRPGFAGWLRSVWDQFTDGPMWRGIASAAVSTILGLFVLPLVGGLASSLVLLFAPLLGGDTVRVPITGLHVAVEWALLVGVLGLIVCAALLAGIAVLHGVLTRAILVPNREAQLVEQAREAGTQRESAVRAGEVERTRIERDLHDGVQPRLVSVAMTLGLAQQKIDDDPTAAQALIDEAHTSTKAAITELRQLARGIHASVLDDRGLDAALSALAARSHVPVLLDVRLPPGGRCSRTAEAAVYFAIAEALTNAAKHSRADEVRVVVRLRDDAAVGGRPTLWARVEDNGVGGARVLPGGGLDGIANRITAAGGASRLDSPAGGPTTLEVSIPCAS
ncbi:histidine kinase [Microbacterium lacticum]|uniref:sensor histidine kinase n=1 Tax=Microbacterium lacticum TaxID=33885 RepID=UPI003A891479